mmetsp:Transcript_31379/g.57609  ORF Transcript_31379/g.57609 Transcript_31379/m.57609 type:complete len:391 (+) Transcript_31379:64-1236(+)
MDLFSACGADKSRTTRGGQVHSGTVFDDYEFGELLGHGAFGEVRKCKSKRGGPELAVKILDLNHDSVKAQQEVLSVKNEVEILQQLHHSNIVKFVDLYEDPQFIYIIQEYVKGGELFEALAMPGAQTEESDVAELARMMMRALQYLHGHDIVHRDIKAQNVLLTNPPQPGRVLLKENIKLIDFGMAGSLPGGQDPGFTQECGSAAYKSPEAFASAPGAQPDWQSKYGRAYGTKADVWAAGVVLFLSLYGRLPFNGVDKREVAAKVCGPNEVDLKPGGVGPSETCSRFLYRVFEKNPNQRCSASEALGDAWLSRMPYVGGRRQINQGTMKNAKMEADDAHKRHGGKERFNKMLQQKRAAVLRKLHLSSQDEDAESEYDYDGDGDEATCTLS